MYLSSFYTFVLVFQQFSCHGGAGLGSGEWEICLTRQLNLGVFDLNSQDLSAWLIKHSYFKEKCVVDNSLRTCSIG